MQTKSIKKRSLWRASAILLSLSLLLCACASPPSDTAHEPIVFTDALGREVSIEKKPERVAALLGSFADIWLLAGGSLSAAAEDAWEDFGLTLDGAISLGGAHSPSLERLLSADPDLVLASASTASNLEMMDTLDTMKIPVAYFDIDHFEDYLAMLSICTDITERKDLYEQNGVALKNRIDAIKTSYQNGNTPAAERKILLLRASSVSIKAKGSEGTILGEMLRDMGCVNIADTNGGLLENLSVEAIMQEDPYRIFVVTMGSNPEAARGALDAMIGENPAWGTLRAVRENRIHVMDKTLFNLKPNERWAEAYEILYETLTSS